MSVGGHDWGGITGYNRGGVTGHDGGGVTRYNGGGVTRYDWGGVGDGSGQLFGDDLASWGYGGDHAAFGSYDGGPGAGALHYFRYWGHASVGGGQYGEEGYKGLERQRKKFR